MLKQRLLPYLKGLLLLEFFLFYSSFILDFDFLFPNHWATIVSLIINPVLSIIGFILLTLTRQWRYLLGLMIFFLSFPLGIMIGYFLSYPQGPLSLESWLTLGLLWLIVLALLPLFYHMFLKNSRALSQKHKWLILGLFFCLLLPIYWEFLHITFLALRA